MEKLKRLPVTLSKDKNDKPVYCKCADHARVPFSLPSMEGGHLVGERCSNCYGVFNWNHAA